MKTLPDFLIVRAAKSGTTSLFEDLGLGLGQHPEAFVPVCKEPCYFSDGHPAIAHSDEEYARLFAGRTTEKVAGEASTSYLYDPPAARRIRRLLPKVKILIMLRDPASRAYSAWGHNFYQVGYERLGFAEALAAEDRRVRSEAFRRECPFFHGGYHYVRAGLYYDQVKRYLDLFGRSQVQVHFFEEFVRDPAATCRAVFEFLGIDARFRPRFHAYNEAPGFRFKRLHRLLVHPPRPIESLYQRLPMTLRIHAYRAGKTAYTLNLKHRPRPPMDEDLRAHLSECFRDDVAKLETLLGRDLSIWNR